MALSTVLQMTLSGMNYTRYLLIWFLLLAGFCMQAQLVPNKPSLYYVTVDIETGNDMIYWTASPTPPDFSWYVIAVSERLNPEDPPTYRTLTTVAVTETQFEHTLRHESNPGVKLRKITLSNSI